MALKRTVRVELIADDLRTVRKQAERAIGACGPVGLEHLLSATTAWQRARMHVSALTPGDNAPRRGTTRKLWGAVSQAERTLAAAQREFGKRCLR